MSGSVESDTSSFSNYQVISFQDKSISQIHNNNFHHLSRKQSVKPDSVTPLNVAITSQWILKRLKLKHFNKDLHWKEREDFAFFQWCSTAAHHKLFAWMKSKNNGHVLMLHEQPSAYMLKREKIQQLAIINKCTKQEISANTINHSIAIHIMPWDFSKCMVALSGRLFAPLIQNDESATLVSKRDFNVQICKFLSNLSSTSLGSADEDILFVPTIEFAGGVKVAQDKELVQHLEYTLISWTRQIKLLSSHEDFSKFGSAYGPLQEIEYWKSCYRDFSRLSKQIQSSQIQRMLEIVEEAKSFHAEAFRAVEKDVHRKKLEAEENMKYLEVLKAPCEELKSSHPSQILELFPVLLNCARLIWSKCLYFRDNERIVGLISGMVNETIQCCVKHIDLDDIFEGREEKAMLSISNAIECGKAWKVHFRRVCKNMRSTTDGRQSWNFSEDEVFAAMDTFVERSRDLMQLSRWQKQFSVSSRPDDFAVFRGIFGNSIMNGLHEIERILTKHTKKIKSLNNLILDINFTRWHDNFWELRAQVDEMETLYIGLMGSIFKRKLSVQTAVMLLDAFYTVTTLPKSKAALEQINPEVWTLFAKNIGDAKNDLEALKTREICMMSRSQEYHLHASAASAARDLGIQLRKEMNYLQLLHYFPYSQQAESVTEAHLEIQSSLAEFQQVTYEEWEKTSYSFGFESLEKFSEDKIAEGNAIPIIQLTADKLLRMNFQEPLWVFLEEAMCWKTLLSNKNSTLTTFSVVSKLHKKLRVSRESVKKLIHKYNSLISSIEPRDVRLMHSKLETLVASVTAGTKDITWNDSEEIQNFVNICMESCDVFGELLSNICKMRDEMSIVLKEIADTSMIIIPSTPVPFKQFVSTQTKNQSEVLSNIFNKSNKLLYIFSNFINPFEQDPIEVHQECCNQFQHMKSSLFEAVNTSLKSSLKMLIKKTTSSNSSSGTSVGLHPLLLIDAVISERQCVELTPKITELTYYFENIFGDFPNHFKIVKQLIDDAG